ncbi:MAG TPA: Hint domain-containing protein [Stellaceae bacterium]|nr:Hint domain-containing protein [Stellaceae bacterium]
MAGPSDLEQLLLQLINDARLDPLGNAARYIVTYSPLTSSDPDIQSALDFFGVDGALLLSQFSALTPTHPLAWNESLAIASRQHDDTMIAADTQSHQLPGEPSFDQRDAAAGYTNFSSLGENIFAFAESPLFAQAGFMVDWGSGPGGMQSPPGHRDNIMDPGFREVGVGIVAESDPLTSVGPLVVTEDFGARFDSGAFILGVAYNDADDNNFYSIGEGLGTLVVTLGATSVTSWASGGFTLNTAATGTQTVTFSGAGLTGTVSATLNLTATTNIEFDVVDGTTLETSGSVSVSGPIATLKGLGVTGLSLSAADATAHAIVGTKGGDAITGGGGADVLTGGLGNDAIDGGAGIDEAVFAGAFASYGVMQSGGTLTVAGPDGTDTLTGIETLVFDDATVPVVCFCRGTRILTDKGELPVEALAVGDRVQTLSGDLKPIVWIGFGCDLVTGKNPLARPIIVRRGALGDEVPRRDLYLTHGHALYFDGVLIPVEHLVNHHSILWDDAARVVEYYHIELADHDVLFAEGAPAETYYDAGNRALFHNARPGSLPGAARPTFAPVLHKGGIVGKVWAALYKGTGERSDASTTDDPDLHLVVDGARLDPTAIVDGVYTFALDARPAGPLLLSSRSAVPSLLGFSRHEHRRLGVAIRQIILQQAGVMTCFDHDARLFAEGGCHLPEEGHSWTDGEFVVPAETFSHLSGAFMLIVQTRKQALQYPLVAPADRRHAVTATAA